MPVVQLIRSGWAACSWMREPSVWWCTGGSDSEVVKGQDVAEPPPSVMLAVTVSLPEINLPGCRIKPLLTSAAVSVTAEALKVLPSRMSVIVAPLAKP